MTGGVWGPPARTELVIKQRGKGQNKVEANWCVFQAASTEGAENRRENP